MSAVGGVAYRLVRVFPVFVTAGLLTLLVVSCNWEKIAEIWQHFHAGYLAACLALVTLSIAIGAVALLILFELKGRVAWWTRFTIDYFYVQALCQLTPAQAGEAALPYIAGRGRFAPGEIAASLVIQRMTSLGIIILVAAVGAGRWSEPTAAWGAAAFFLLSGLAFIALITNLHTRNWLNNFVVRRFGPILYGFYDTWTEIFRKRRGRLLLHALLMIGRFVVGVAAAYVTLMAFDVAVPFWDLAALSAFTTLAAVVPISINGIGVTEGIFVAALADYGYGTEQVLTACLVGRVLWILTVLLWSSVYWFLGRRDGQAMAGVRG